MYYVGCHDRYPAQGFAALFAAGLAGCVTARALLACVHTVCICVCRRVRGGERSPHGECLLVYVAFMHGGALDCTLSQQRVVGGTNGVVLWDRVLRCRLWL